MPTMSESARATRRPRAVETQSQALREHVLEALKRGSGTTKQIAAVLQLEAQPVYRALLKLQEEGKVTSFADRRGTAVGRIGRVWSLSEQRKVTCRRDLLLWAVFGSQGKPSA